MHWLKYSLLCQPKDNAGLGFRDLNLLNQAFLAKQGWRIFSQPNLLLSQVMQARYFEVLIFFLLLLVTDRRSVGGVSMAPSTCSGLAAALTVMAPIPGHTVLMALTQFVVATTYYLSYKDGARVQEAKLQDPTFSPLFGKLFGGSQSLGSLKFLVGGVFTMFYLLVQVCLLKILLRTFHVQSVIISAKQRCMLYFNVGGRKLSGRGRICMLGCS
ncbi:hypothetical protein QQ045_003327 [Rhodiola kirilowii]